ncbi:MAG: hypothetical protein IKW60_04035 [Clostridia bacterium]|nr:hypothetical protein [Clostridia bacterium]
MNETDFVRTYYPIYALISYNPQLFMQSDSMLSVILPDTLSKIQKEK